jgi:hypothetical protein
MALNGGPFTVDKKCVETVFNRKIQLSKGLTGVVPDK